MRGWIAVFAVLISGMFSAACAEIALPAIYQVTAISSDDALNVRSGPSTAYLAIGSLQNGAQVEVTADTGEGWARILHGEGNGWVAMRYLQPLPASAMPDTLFCGGTEPFWSLTLEPDGSLVFTEAGQQSQPIPPDWRHGVSGRPPASFAVGSDVYAALFHRRTCSDGMSDRTYGWALDFLRIGGEGAYLKGCCRMLR